MMTMYHRNHMTSLYMAKISEPYNQPDDGQFSSKGRYENVIGMVNFPKYMEAHRELGMVEEPILVGDEFIWKLTELGKQLIVLGRI